MKAKSIIAFIIISFVSVFAFADSATKYFSYDGEKGYYEIRFVEDRGTQEVIEANLDECPQIKRLTKFDDYAIRQALASFICEKGDIYLVLVSKLNGGTVTQAHGYLTTVKNPSEYGSYIEYSFIGADCTDWYINSEED